MIHGDNEFLNVNVTFSSLIALNTSSKKTGLRYNCYCLSLNSNEAFAPYYTEFYINGKKHIPVHMLEEYYTPIAMAAHYMDDGSCCKEDVSIATCSFEANEINQLRAFLLKKYNIFLLINVI